MVRRPLQTENLRAAVLFRIVEQIQPTLLLDEVDTYLPGDDELRGLLNAGHKHGATVFRCEGEGRLRAFNAFAPAALAGIGHLPATLHDRSIHIPLIKALPDEAAAHFDKTQIEVEKVLARKLARWAKDNHAILKATRPVLPANAYNRLGDNWRPLFAIAQVIGGDWPARALASFNQLTAKPRDDAQSLGIRLLSDIRQVFMESGAKRLPSKNLVATLLDMADRPWLEANTGRGAINERWLARHLSPFGINAVILRIGDQRLRGYELNSFTDAFTRFLQ
jgi:putative DNA primase/helicase